MREIYRALRLSALGAKFALAPYLGAKARYGIDAGYTHRRKTAYFDDTVNEDEWQLEVYQRAHDIMKSENLSSVCDVGCGSAYKLMKHLGEFKTTGIDLPETIETVRSRFPDREWIAGSFDEVSPKRADLVVCSDVIEHVADPDELMRFVCSIAIDRVVISTPGRELMYDERNKCRFGPPDNPAHLREWSTGEFNRYVSGFIDIETHEISNLDQATQMIVGRAKKPAISS